MHKIGEKDPAKKGSTAFEICMLTVQCPQCGFPQSVSKAFKGKVKCKACLQEFMVKNIPKKPSKKINVKLIYTDDSGNRREIKIGKYALVYRMPTTNFEVAIKTEYGEFMLGIKSKYFSRKDLKLGKKGHFEIVVTENKIFIRDLESTFGTLVNNTRIIPLKTVYLKDEDEIIVGPTRFKIKIEEIGSYK